MKLQEALVVTNKKSNDVYYLLNEELTKVDAILKDEVLLEAIGGFSIYDIAFVRKLKKAWSERDVGVFIGKPTKQLTKDDKTKVFFAIKMLERRELHPMLRLLKQIVIAAMVIAYILALIALGATGTAAAFWGLVRITTSKGAVGAISAGLIETFTGIQALIHAAKETTDTGVQYITHIENTAEDDYEDFRSFLIKTYGQVRLFQVITKVLRAGVGGVANVAKNTFDTFGKLFHPSGKTKMGLTRMNREVDAP